MAIKWTLKYVKDGQTVGAYDVYARQHMMEDVAALACEYDRVTVTKSYTIVKDCIVYVLQRNMHYVIIDGECVYWSEDYKKAKKFVCTGLRTTRKQRSFTEVSWLRKRRKESSKMAKTKRALAFSAHRQGYGIDQLCSPTTVGELKRMLEDFDDDTLVVLSHDNDYTFGNIDLDDYAEWVQTTDEDGDEDWEKEEY